MGCYDCLCSNSDGGIALWHYTRANILRGGYLKQERGGWGWIASIPNILSG